MLNMAFMESTLHFSFTVFYPVDIFRFLNPKLNCKNMDYCSFTCCYEFLLTKSYFHFCDSAFSSDIAGIYSIPSDLKKSYIA